MCEIKTHFVVLYGYFWYYYFHRLFGVKKVKESAQVKQRNINLFLKAPCVRFFHLELMYCLQDHPEIMPCCSKNAAKSLLIHCQKLPAALSATFLFIAVGNLKLVAKGTQSFYNAPGLFGEWTTNNEEKFNFSIYPIILKDDSPATQYNENWACWAWKIVLADFACMSLSRLSQGSFFLDRW